MNPVSIDNWILEELNTASNRIYILQFRIYEFDE